MNAAEPILREIDPRITLRAAIAEVAKARAAVEERKAAGVRARERLAEIEERIEQAALAVAEAREEMADVIAEGGGPPTATAVRAARVARAFNWCVSRCEGSKPPEALSFVAGEPRAGRSRTRLTGCLGHRAIQHMPAIPN
jgi:hypothetical protein